MLELRPCCEHCGKSLPAHSQEAMICSLECTYCEECALHLFKNVCPGCGGNFQPRPIRPKKYVSKYPPSAEKLVDPKNIKEGEKLIEKYVNINPWDR